MDYHTAESWFCLNLHLPWTPVHSAGGIEYLIYTSYGLHPLLIIATSFIITSFNLHLPWTSKSLHITLCVMISTSHGLPHHRSWLCLNLYLPWTPVHSAEAIKCFIYTSYGLHPFLIIATSFIITSFNLHLPWTTTISPYNSVCYDLHLSWTTTLQKRIVFEYRPPMDSWSLCRSYTILNLHLLWTSPIVDHCYIIHHYLFQSPPPMDFYNISI